MTCERHTVEGKAANLEEARAVEGMAAGTAAAKVEGATEVAVRAVVVMAAGAVAEKVVGVKEVAVLAVAGSVDEVGGMAEKVVVWEKAAWRETAARVLRACCIAVAVVQISPARRTAWRGD